MSCYTKNDKGSIGFTYPIKTLENLEEEFPMAHIMDIWQIKDGKMFKGDQISPPADETQEN